MGWFPRERNWTRDKAPAVGRLVDVAVWGWGWMGGKGEKREGVGSV